MKIIENTFKNPYEIRKVALSLKYSTSDSLRWPGYRINIPDFINNQYLTSIKNHLDKNSKLKNAYFQYSDKHWISGSCHFDDTKYTCVTFLNIDSQANSGIEIYDEKYCSPQTGKLLDTFNPIKTKYYASKKTLPQKILFQKQLEKLNLNFKDPCIISNKFNRTVIFDSYKIHRAQNFFGDKISNSRLTLVSFFL